MMYDFTFFWFVRWIYTDSGLAATIHSRSLWVFLRRVARVKARRRKTRAVSDIPRVPCAASIILSFTIWTITTLVFTFHKDILSQVQYILSSRIPKLLSPMYKVNAKLAIGQLQLVMSAPIGGHYLISDVTNVVRFANINVQCR